MNNIKLLLIPTFVVSLLVGCNKPKQYTVAFDTGEGGSEVPAQIIKEKEKVNKPTDPTKVKEGYTCSFLHWELDNKEFSFNTPIISDITLKARWKEDINIYTVIFDVDGDKEKIAPQKVMHGNRATKPDDPDKKPAHDYRYSFAGWYLNEQEFNFNRMITSNITLKAKWEDISRIYYKVTLTNNEEYGSVTGSGTYEKGLNVTVNATSKDGYYFAGWKIEDKIVSTDANYPFRIYEDTTLIALYNSSFLSDYECDIDKDDGTVIITNYTGEQTDIIIPESIVFNSEDNVIGHIGNDAYRDFNNITSIVIANTTKTIGDNAFHSCENLKSIKVGSGLSSISEYAFLSCSALETIIVDVNNKTYDSRNNCNAIIQKEGDVLIVGSNNTIISNDIKKIANNAFSDRNTIKSIIIPDNVISIGEFAFNACDQLESVSISKSSKLQSIGDSAFSLCDSLSGSIYIPIGVTYVGSSAFFGDEKLDEINCAAKDPIYYKDSPAKNWDVDWCEGCNCVVKWDADNANNK